MNYSSETVNSESNKSHDKEDLKITLQYNQITGESWYELFNSLSGEVLYNGDLQDCENHFKTLDPLKYELLPN